MAQYVKLGSVDVVVPIRCDSDPGERVLNLVEYGKRLSLGVSTSSSPSDLIAPLSLVAAEISMTHLSLPHVIGRGHSVGPSVELVVLDLFGTLVEAADPRSVLTALKAEGAVIAPEAGTWLVEGMPAAPALIEMGIEPSSVRELHLTGRFESVEAFLFAVRRAFPRAPRPSAESIAVGERAARLSLEGAHMIEEITGLLEGLRHRVAVQLVSDCSWQSARVIDSLELRRWFPEPILSCEVGHLKRDGTAFEIARRRARCPADRGVVVGDGWQSDVLGAVSAGMQAVLIDRSGQHPCRMLIDDLRPVLAIGVKGNVAVRREVRGILDALLPASVASIERDPDGALYVADDGRVTLRALDRVSVAGTLLDALNLLVAL